MTVSAGADRDAIRPVATPRTRPTCSSRLHPSSLILPVRPSRRWHATAGAHAGGGGGGLLACAARGVAACVRSPTDGMMDRHRRAWPASSCRPQAVLASLAMAVGVVRVIRARGSPHRRGRLPDARGVPGSDATRSCNRPRSVVDLAEGFEAELIIDGSSCPPTRRSAPSTSSRGVGAARASSSAGNALRSGPEHRRSYPARARSVI